MIQRRDRDAPNPSVHKTNIIKEDARIRQQKINDDIILEKMKKFSREHTARQPNRTITTYSNNTTNWKGSEAPTNSSWRKK